MNYFDRTETDADGRLFLPDIDPEEAIQWPNDERTDPAWSEDEREQFASVREAYAAGYGSEEYPWEGMFDGIDIAGVEYGPTHGDWD